MSTRQILCKQSSLLSGICLDNASPSQMALSLIAGLIPLLVEQSFSPGYTLLCLVALFMAYTVAAMRKESQIARAKPHLTRGAMIFTAAAAAIAFCNIFFANIGFGNLALVHLASALAIATAFLWLSCSRYSPQELLRRSNSMIAQCCVDEKKRALFQELCKKDELGKQLLFDDEQAIACFNQSAKAIDRYCQIMGKEARSQFQGKRNSEQSPVSWDFLDGGVGIVRISNFMSRKLQRDLPKALVNLRSCRALILDLRWNGGGLSSYALFTLQCLLDQGKLMRKLTRIRGVVRFEDFVLTRSRLQVLKSVAGKQSIKEKCQKRQKNLWAGRPIVVLINERTCSSAEIVAAGLKDNKRAILVGNKTFGKGIGQKTIPMVNGTMLKVTTTVSFRPNEENIGDGSGANNQGIVPDYFVEGNPAGRENLRGSHAEDRQLQFALTLLHRQLA